MCWQEWLDGSEEGTYLLLFPNRSTMATSSNGKNGSKSMLDTQLSDVMSQVSTFFGNGPPGLPKPKKKRQKENTPVKHGNSADMFSEDESVEPFNVEQKQWLDQAVGSSLQCFAGHMLSRVDARMDVHEKASFDKQNTT